MKSLLFILLFGISIGVTQSPDIPEIETDSALTYAEREVWHSILEWPQSVEDEFLSTRGSINPDDYGGLKFYDLENERYLVEIQTLTAAYQGAYIYMFYNKKWDEASEIIFPTVHDNTNNDQLTSQIGLTGLPTFDEDTKELEMYNRSRGVGGCGTLERYSFENEDAQLVSVRSQSCEEADTQGQNMLLSPHDWPLIWPIQQELPEK